MIEPNKQRSPFSRNLQAGSLLLLSALASCDAGGKAKTIGISGPTTGPVLQVDFGLRREIALGSNSIGDVLHTDLNADGIEDLVETNFLPMQISLAFGNPDGTFSTIAQLATMGHAWRLATGDFDGDGSTDIAVANQEYLGTGSMSVQVFLQGPGVGEFTAAPHTAVLAADPIDIAVAPISGTVGDVGPDELFVALRDEHRVSVMSLNAFALVETASLESSNLGAVGGPFSIAAIDLGGDGALDLVVGEVFIVGEPDRVVHYGRDAGAPNGFAAAGLVMSPVFRPIVDNVGDIDANTFDDIAVAQRGADSVYLFKGDAAGLSQAIHLEFGGRTTSLIFPDLDGDGLAEAVATLLNQSSIQVRPGTGPMAWGEPVHYNVGPVPRAIDVILLPGDLVPDLLCGNAFGISMLTGVGSGVFRGARGYRTGLDAPRGVKLADLDNDGADDAVVVSQKQRRISFMKGGADGSFEARVVLPLMPTENERPGVLAIADMDMDGLLDVITSVEALDEIRFYRNNGAIDNFVDPLPTQVTAVGSGPAGIAIADFTDDALPDVIVANSTGNSVQVLANTGGGSLVAMPELPVAFKPEGCVAMDFDADGFVDAAVFGETVTDFIIAILRGDGTGMLAVDEFHIIPSASDGISLGDFNEDGLPDMVVGQTLLSGSNVLVLMNQGNLSFNAEPLAIAPGPAAVYAADINNDLHLDILVATSGGEFRAALGDGTGAFPSVIPGGNGELPVPFYTLDIELADLNGDQLRDLVMVGPLSPLLWVGLNTSSPVQQP